MSACADSESTCSEPEKWSEIDYHPGNLNITWEDSEVHKIKGEMRDSITHQKLKKKNSKIETRSRYKDRLWEEFSQNVSFYST